MKNTKNDDKAILTALNEPAKRYAGGIKFAMMDGPIRVICWVSSEALDVVAGCDPSRQDRMVCFERYRLDIERAARNKYSDGEHSPIVMSYDLGTSS